MKFHLKVHSIIGGAPGEPGSGSVRSGGDVGFGRGGNGRDKDKKVGKGFGYFFDALSLAFPPAALVNAGIKGITGTSIGQKVAGDVGGPFGVAPPGPVIGFGTGGGGSTDTQKQIATLLTAPPLEPAPPAPPTAVAKEAEKRRRRIGRQETILTGLLGDASINKPTLLGL